MQNLPKTLRIVLIGDVKVGKSTLRQRAHQDRVDDQYLPTIGVELGVQRIHDCSVQLWDASGDERFRGLLKPYLRNASAVICYDVTNRISFTHVRDWLAFFKNEIGSVPHTVALVATKAESTQRVVSADEGQTLAKELGISMFFEVSARHDTQRQINDMLGDVVDAALYETSYARAKHDLPTSPSTQKKSWQLADKLVALGNALDRLFFCSPRV